MQTIWFTLLNRRNSLAIFSRAVISTTEMREEPRQMQRASHSRKTTTIRGLTNSKIRFVAADTHISMPLKKATHLTKASTISLQTSTLIDSF